MRNLAKKEALEEAAGRRLGKTLEIKQLDVCDEQSIKTCVNSIPDRRIDVLGKYKMCMLWTDKFSVYRLFKYSGEVSLVYFLNDQINNNCLIYSWFLRLRADVD